MHLKVIFQRGGAAFPTPTKFLLCAARVIGICWYGIYSDSLLLSMRLVTFFLFAQNHCAVLCQEVWKAPFVKPQRRDGSLKTIPASCGETATALALLVAKSLFCDETHKFCSHAEVTSRLFRNCGKSRAEETLLNMMRKYQNMYCNIQMIS